jgi:hypothetical protein
MDSNNNNTTVGIILVLILMAILVYVKPTYFKYLFKTIFGNIILIGIIISIGFMNIKWAIGLSAIFFMIYTAFNYKEGFKYMKEGFKYMKEGFKNTDIEDEPLYTATIWPQKLIDDFIQFEKIHNPNLRFDMNIIQKQATPAEAEILLKSGKWSWSKEIENMYQESISQNTIINSETLASLNVAQTIYNQTAILELLSWNSKEGTFLLNGAIIGHTKDMPADVNNIIKCGSDGMEKIEYTGYDGINGSILSNVTPVNDADLPNLINGFTFLNTKCNPCTALENSYTCPFALNTGNGIEVSSVWKYLWNLNNDLTPISDSTNESNSSTPEDVSSININDFPLLTQLNREIIKGSEMIDANIILNSSSPTDSAVPPILTDVTNKKNIYYGNKNMN